jgi:D-serine deaminase-like pyridoxal phosphate-dependent protein
MTAAAADDPAEVEPARLDRASAALDPPFAVVDLDALDANAADLVRRASGKPIRVASKSVRCREVLGRVLARDGFAGVLAYSLAEALWLAGGDEPVSTDVVVAYPSVDRAALRRLATDETAATRVTLMIDSADHLDLIDAVAPAATRPTLRICLDVDASLRAAGGRVHVGVRRSPVHEPAAAAALARTDAAGLRCPRLERDGRVRWRRRGQPPPAGLLAELRRHRDAVARLLAERQAGRDTGGGGTAGGRGGVPRVSA